MIWITVPQLSKAIGLPEDIIYEWIDEGRIETWQNPSRADQGKRAKYRIRHDSVPDILTSLLRLSEATKTEVLKSLGLNFKQLRIPFVA